MRPNTGNPESKPSPASFYSSSTREREKKFYRCELRDHGYGASRQQVFEGEHVFHAQMFRDTPDE
jgi:hypothetical protein